MSLLPIIFGESMMDSFRPSRILNQHFGDVLAQEDLLAPFTIAPLSRHGYYRPWRSSAANRETGSTVSADQDKFQVNLDVQQFKPEEITLKVTGNKQITVEGKHEEKQDEHGYISRHFVRRYAIPDNYDMEKIVSNLSSDGVLTITAPNTKSQAIEHKEIPINQTGKPAVEQSKEQKEK